MPLNQNNSHFVGNTIKPLNKTLIVVNLFDSRLKFIEMRNRIKIIKIKITWIAFNNYCSNQEIGLIWFKPNRVLRKAVPRSKRFFPNVWKESKVFFSDFVWFVLTTDPLNWVHILIADTRMKTNGLSANEPLTAITSISQNNSSQ